MRGRQAQTTNLAQDGTASYESSAILESLSKTFPLENPNERVSYGGELKDVPRDQLALFYRNDRNNVIGHVFTVLPKSVYQTKTVDHRLILLGPPVALTSQAPQNNSMSLSLLATRPRSGEVVKPSSTKVTAKP